jgi:peroxin-6
VGESERQIRDVFERARDAAPCVIFFDEIDALAPNRGAASDSGGVMDRVVSQLLAELDGVQPSAQVFALAATNRPDLLDPSLLRPGRFDKLVYIGVAEDRAQQLQVLTALTRKFALAADVSLPALAERCSLRFSGADFYALCADALMRAIRDQAAALPAPSLAEASLGRDEDEDEDEDDGGAGAPEAPAPKVVVAARHFAQALETLTPSVSVEEAARYQRIQESFLQPERGGVQNGHS